MKVQSRLHIYPSADIKGQAVIIGETTALKELGRALLRAAENPVGFETVNLYKGTGHDYEIFITKNITESEWQDTPKDPKQLSFVDDYNNLKKTLLLQQNN